jgi:hypothetical protein
MLGGWPSGSWRLTFLLLPGTLVPVYILGGGGPVPSGRVWPGGLWPGGVCLPGFVGSCGVGFGLCPG